MTRRPAIAMLLAATALVLAACGSGAATAAPTPTAAPATVAPATTAPGTPAAETGPASEAPSSAPATAAPPSAAVCEVVEGTTGAAAEIKGFSYPSGLSVAAGESITWTNADSVPHTVTFAEGGCDSGAIAGGGGSATVTYLVPGTYPFVCRFHPAMRGSLEVTGEG